MVKKSKNKFGNIKYFTYICVVNGQDLHYELFKAYFSAST